MSGSVPIFAGEGVTLVCVAAVHCRNTGRRVSRVEVALRTLVAPIAGIIAVVGLVGPFALGAGATTSTTLPGPAPNQAQINAATSQVDQIEATLSQEEQQLSVLDNRYDTAVQNLQTAQSALQAIDGKLTQTTVSAGQRAFADASSAN